MELTIGQLEDLQLSVQIRLDKAYKEYWPNTKPPQITYAMVRFVIEEYEKGSE